MVLLFKQSQLNNKFNIKNERYKLEANINYDEHDVNMYYITVDIKDMEADEDVGVFCINPNGHFWYLDLYDCELEKEEEKQITQKALNILKLFFDVSKYESMVVSAKELQPIPANSNPFHFDLERSGVDLVAGYIAMYQTPLENEDLETFILINTRTGRRIEIDLKPV